jgi:ParB family transcriptional regulator, chromosome partitioning protein
MNALAADIITDAEMADVSTPVAALTAEGAEFDTPLNTLRRSKHNVRKPGSAKNVAILKASLLNHGQLHPLLVLPGKAGTWEVVAGGSRFDAFAQLRQEKKILNTYPVRVKRITPEMAREISMAENLVRESMSPVDEYLAYARIIKEGASAQDVADRFGVSLAHIERRLKLAALSPKLLELRREGQISDEQVKALTLSDSHKEQEAAWFDHPESYNRTPSALRSRLTREQINAASDRWALFVGAEAYEAAGGRINRDLFAQEGTAGYWLDAPILARLVDEKLATFAETVKAEGWSWVEAHNEKGYVSVHEFRRINREEVGLNREDEQELNALWAEKEAFESLERDELSAEDERRLEQIETRLDALEEKRCVWTPAQMALAGVIIALNSMGEPLVTRGLLKPDVRLPQQEEQGDADGEAMEDDQEEGEREGSDDGAKKPDLSAALVLDLSAQRTAALRAALMDRPDIALISVVYALMAPVFYDRNHDTALEIRVNTCELSLKKYAADVENGKGHKAIAARIGD